MLPKTIVLCVLAVLTFVLSAHMFFGDGSEAVALHNADGRGEHAVAYLHTPTANSGWSVVELQVRDGLRTTIRHVVIRDGETIVADNSSSEHFGGMIAARSRDFSSHFVHVPTRYAGRPLRVEIDYLLAEPYGYAHFQSVRGHDQLQLVLPYATLAGQILYRVNHCLSAFLVLGLFSLMVFLVTLLVPRRGESQGPQLLAGLWVTSAIPLIGLVGYWHFAWPLFRTLPASVAIHYPTIAVITLNLALPAVWLALMVVTVRLLGRVLRLTVRTSGSARLAFDCREHFGSSVGL